MKLVRTDGYIYDTENEDVIKSLTKRGFTVLSEDKPVKTAKKAKSKELIPEVKEEPIKAVETVAKNLSTMTVSELKEYALSIGINGAQNMTRPTLLAVIEEHRG